MPSLRHKICQFNLSPASQNESVPFDIFVGWPETQLIRQRVNANPRNSPAKPSLLRPVISLYPHNTFSAPYVLLYFAWKPH